MGSLRKGVTEEIVMRAIKDTKQLVKTPARSIASPIPVIKESTLKKASNISFKGDYPILPVVNESGHLIGIWKEGAILKRYKVAREGTRIKNFIDDVFVEPVIVIDKQRKPIGYIGKTELLELAASLREFDIPIYYVGKELLNEFQLSIAQREVDRAMSKIVRILPVNYAKVIFSKKGTWVVNVKLSTEDRMYMVSKEDAICERALSKALDSLVRMVLRKK